MPYLHDCYILAGNEAHESSDVARPHNCYRDSRCTVPLDLDLGDCCFSRSLYIIRHDLGGKCCRW